MKFVEVYVFSYWEEQKNETRCTITCSNSDQQIQVFYEDGRCDYRLMLEKIIEAIDILSDFDRKIIRRVIVNHKSIHKGLTDWKETWEESDWRTGSGGKVKHKELWEEITRLIRRRKVEFYLSTEYKYIRNGKIQKPRKFSRRFRENYILRVIHGIDPFDI